MRRGLRLSFPVLSVAAMVLAAAGCADRTNPTAVAGPSFARASGGNGQGIRLTPNSEPYAVGGIRPATGRSGSAAISAEAAISGASAVLTVTSYRASDTDFSGPEGDIYKLQIKAYDASGRLLFVDNQNNLTPASSTRSFTYAGLPPGTRFVVQAYVKDIDRKRTDVVTLPAVIVAKPVDLAVSALTIPTSAGVHEAVPITVRVAELNGDQNARANVVLYVQDVPVQTIQNVYVAAGDEVSCAFAYAFPAVTTYGVRVVVQNVVPADVNPDNNFRYGTIAISGSTGSGGGPPPPVLRVTGQGSDLTIDRFDSTRTKQWTPWYGGLTQPGSFDAPTVPPTSDNLSYTFSFGRDQFSELFGQYYGPLTFPIDSMILRQGFRSSSAVPAMDVVMHEFVGAGLPNNGSGTAPCYSQAAGSGVIFSLCEYTDGFTRLTYVRGLANVTYVSQRFNFLIGSGSCASLPGAPAASDDAAVADGLQCYIVNQAAGPSSGFATWDGYHSLVLSAYIKTGGVRFEATIDIPLTASSIADQPIDGLQPFFAIPAQTTCFSGLGCTTTPGSATWAFVKHRYSEVGIYAAATSGEFSGVPVTSF